MMKHWVCGLSLILLTLAAAPALAQVDPNLEGWWKLDGDALDYSGNDRHGTLMADASFVEEGVYGGSLLLDGSGDYVNIDGYKGILADDGVQQPFTVTCWLKTTGNAEMVTWGNNSGRQRLSFRVDGGTLRTEHGSGNLRGNTVVNDGEWHHAALVVSEGASLRVPQTLLYADGVEDGTFSGSDNTYNLVGTADVSIGRRATNNDRYFNGQIDEVRIYSRTLSADEIEALAVRPTAYSPSPANGAVGATTALLEWMAAGNAASQKVYASPDAEITEADVVAAVLPGNQQLYPLFGSPLFTPGATIYWRVDSIEADQTVMEGPLWQFTVSPMEAWDPSPDPDQPNVVLDANLTWQPGFDGLTHDLYFGTDEAAVAAADASVFVGNLAATSYTPALTESTTYYWRVDEVVADGSVTQGAVWSFSTVPPIAIVDPNLLGWWTFDSAAGSTAIDWSGHGNHGEIRGGAEWVEGYANTALNFDGVDNFIYTGKTADELGIEGAEPKSVTAWVYTRGFNNGGIFDLGARSNGQNFCLRTLATTNQWRTQHWGSAADHDFTFAVQNEWAHMALIYDGVTSAVYANGSLISSNATTLDTSPANPFQIGVYGWQVNFFDGLIDDVRLYDKALTVEELAMVMRIDPLLAWDPNPMNGELTDVVKAETLTWQAGDMAADHDVYLGMDRAAIAEADTADDVYQGQVGGTSFSVTDPLMWDQQYFWRVDEVNTDGSVTKGLIWSFTTADYLIVENFESYDADQDEGGNAVFLTWIDGFGDDTNGSVVGYIDPANGTFNETADVHTGSQAMPFEYNNTAANLSEATRELSPAEDWTLDDLTDLTIWFKGAPVDFVETADGITMSASGVDIWGVSDEFRYAYKNLSGDGTVVVKVESLVDTNAWAKAGVMIRETLEPGSKHAYVVATPGNGVSFGWRQFTADTSGSSTVGGIQTPVWVKLTRSGDTFTAQYSTDGVAWEDFTDADGVPVATEITMTSSVTAGLALTSHNAGATTTAEFSEVDIDGSGSLQVAEVGVDHPGNTPDQLYVIVEDTAGGSATVEHPDGPAAVNIADWTEWKIPLADLAGVNLTRVGSVTLGVGNANMDGTGMLLFDDILVTKPVPVPTLTLAPTAVVEATGDDGEILTINGIAAADLIVGTTTFAGEPKHSQYPPEAADDFDLSTPASGDDQEYIQTVFAQPVTTIFVMERGANDSGFIQAMDADGNVTGEMVPFSPDDFAEIGYTALAPQKGGGLVITADMPISGVRFFPPADGPLGIDPASVSAVPAE